MKSSTTIVKGNRQTTGESMKRKTSSNVVNHKSKSGKKDIKKDVTSDNKKNGERTTEAAGTARGGRGIRDLPEYIQGTVETKIIPTVIERIGSLTYPWALAKQLAFFRSALHDAILDAHPQQRTLPETGDRIWNYVCDGICPLRS